MKKLLLISFLLFVSILSANPSKLYLKKKLSVIPYLSNSIGMKLDKNTELQKNSNIFISYKPNGTWNLKEKHRKKYFNKIIFQQEDSKITPVRITCNKHDNEISSYTMEIASNMVIFYKPLKLFVGDNQPCGFLIPEQNWPGYNDLMNHKTTGLSNLQNKQYLLALEEFNYFFHTEPQIEHLSFYNNVINFYKQSIQSFLRSNKHKVNILEMDSMQEVNKEMLIEITSHSDSLEILKDISKNFLTVINSDEANKISDNIKQQIFNVSNIHSNIENSFDDKQINFFLKNDYSIYKFHLYLELLAKLLINRNNISEISKIEKISVDLIDNMPNAKEELVSLNWFDDFCNFVEVINRNITDNECLFNENLLLHFDSLKESEPEPYSQIFRAFNILVKGDTKEFIDNLSIIFENSTKTDNILSLEMWLLSYKTSKDIISKEIVNQINSGLNYLEQKELMYAENVFDLVRKKSGTFAPANYYYGLIKHKNLEPIPASIFFEKALLGYPEYNAPRIFLLENYMHNRDFKTALTEVEIALSVNKYWIYYYHKANILYNMDRFDEAKEICMTYCMELNKNNFDLMILIGDIFFKNSDLNNAKKYYHIGGLMKPEEPIFIERMTIINKYIDSEKRNSG